MPWRPKGYLKKKYGPLCPVANVFTQLGVGLASGKPNWQASSHSASKSWPNLRSLAVGTPLSERYDFSAPSVAWDASNPILNTAPESFADKSRNPRQKSWADVKYPSASEGFLIVRSNLIFPRPCDSIWTLTLRRFQNAVYSLQPILVCRGSPWGANLQESIACSPWRRLTCQANPAASAEKAPQHVTAGHTAQLRRLLCVRCAAALSACRFQMSFASVFANPI